MTRRTKIWLPLLLAVLLVASVAVAACAKTATVTYASGATGVTGTAPESQTVTIGDKITLPANPFTRTGYTFTGWSDGTTTYQPGAEYTVNGDVKFTAQWEEDKAPDYTPRTYFFSGKGAGSISVSNWGGAVSGVTFTRQGTTNVYKLEGFELVAGDEMKLRFNAQDWNNGSTQYSYNASFFPTELFEGTDNAKVKAGADGTYDITLTMADDYSATTGAAASQITSFTFTPAQEPTPPTETVLTAIAGVWTAGTSKVVISEAGSEIDDDAVGSIIIGNQFVTLWQLGGVGDIYGYNSLDEEIEVAATETGITVSVDGQETAYTTKTALDNIDVKDIAGTYKRTGSTATITINEDGTATMSNQNASDITLYIVDEYIVITYMQAGSDYQFLFTLEGTTLTGYFTQFEAAPSAVTYELDEGEPDPGPGTDPEQPDEVTKPTLAQGETLYKGESTRTVAGDNTLVIVYIAIDIRSTAATARFFGLYNNKYFTQTVTLYARGGAGAWYEGPDAGDELYYYDGMNVQGAALEMAVFENKIILCSDYDEAIADGTFTFEETNGGDYVPDVPGDKCEHPDCDCENCEGEGCECDTYERTSDKKYADFLGDWEGTIEFNETQYTKLKLESAGIQILGEDWVAWTLDYTDTVGRFLVVYFYKTSTTSRYYGTITFTSETTLKIEIESLGATGTFTKSEGSQGGGNETPLPENADGTYKFPAGMTDLDDALYNQGYAFNQAVLSGNTLTLSINGQYGEEATIEWDGNVGTGKFTSMQLRWYALTITVTEGQMLVTITVDGTGYSATFTKDSGTTDPGTDPDPDPDPTPTEGKLSDFGGANKSEMVYFGYTSEADATAGDGTITVVGTSVTRVIHGLGFYYVQSGYSAGWTIAYYYPSSATNQHYEATGRVKYYGTDTYITEQVVDNQIMTLTVAGVNVTVEFGVNEQNLRTVTLTFNGSSVTWTEVQ